MIRILIGLVWITGCTETVQLNQQLAGLVALAITPGTATMTVTDLDTPQQLAFTATGQFTDGSTRDITPYVQWSVDNTAPGSFVQPGTYATSNAAGGHVVVTADSGTGQTATAAVVVIVSATIVDSAFPPPGDPATLFPPGAVPITGDPMHSPSVQYPSDGTMFPQGVGSTLFQYTSGMQNDAFRLSFDSDVLHLTVLTGAVRWSANGSIWSLVAASGVDAPVALVVAGTDSSSVGSIYASAPIALAFSRDSPAGLIYFWSAATSGIMSGSLATSSAGKVYPADNTCVGCHTVSRDGSQLAMEYGGETLQTISLPSLATEIAGSANLPMGWATYSPDGSRLLVATAGVLTLYDASTGAPVGMPGGQVMLPPMMFATHPDWSPDGSHIAVALTKMKPTNMDMNVDAASIALLPVDNDMIGMPQMLVMAIGMDNDYFPKYSPDGKYIAFVHATADSHGAPDAELRLVSASGGMPIALGIASHRVGSVDGVMNVADTMPSWATTSGDYDWLAFSSSRAYGAIVPAGGKGQIWIAAIAPDAAGDPSAAAFWLPCQDVTALNNNPIWSGSTGANTP